MPNDLAILENQLRPLAPRFAEVLPKHLPVERLMRTVLISVERLPKLLECDRQSIFNAAMSAACLGLEVDGVTGQAYLIPFKGKAQLVIGYKGYNTMAARSGIAISGAVVREGDEFDFELGNRAFVRHRPALGNRARIIAAWACATSIERPAVVAVMGIDELMAVKAKSPGGRRDDSPWNDAAIGFPAMCEKTVKRRLARSLPLNVMHYAARMDEAVDEQGQAAWISPDKGVVIEGDVIPPRHDTRTPTAADLIQPPSPPSQPSQGDAAGHPVPPGEESTSGGAGDDPLEACRQSLREAAQRGKAAMAAEWRTIHPRYQAALVQEKERLKPIAEEADQRAGVT